MAFRFAALARPEAGRRGSSTEGIRLIELDQDDLGARIRGRAPLLYLASASATLVASRSEAVVVARRTRRSHVTSRRTGPLVL